MSGVSKIVEEFGVKSKNILIGYGVGAVLCLSIYAYRRGVHSLREFLIEKRKNPNIIEANTKLDAVLYGSLKGVVRGFIPSIVWPMILTSYITIKINESSLERELNEEYDNVAKFENKD